MKKMEIINEGKKISIGEDSLFIVAEGGINHDADIDKARQLIDAAVRCGADAIKFQTHIPQAEMLKEAGTGGHIKGETLYELMTRMELSREQHIELKDYAKNKGILLFFTPYSREAADLLEELDMPLFKIGSGELTNYPFLEYVARKGKPMIISTGMSTLNEIKEAVKTVRKHNDNLAVLHCTSMYPTPAENVNLKIIQKLQNELNLPVGFSDHTEGIYAALGAVAYGACILEKHFTISREWPGPDQKCSMEPDELGILVKGARFIKKAIGNQEKIITAEEQRVRDLFSESIISLEAIPKGTVITKDMVWVKRPSGGGIPPKELHLVIGKKAVKDIPGNTQLRRNDLAR
ncbi:N-acetylneuraminate synthase family protein [Candidatus Omnitrophota bacterium]